jgi:hypothetical protein
MKLSLVDGSAVVGPRWSHSFASKTSRPNLLDFCLWGWTKGGVHKRKVDAREKLLGRTLDASASIKKRAGSTQTRNTRSSLWSSKVQ